MKTKSVCTSQIQVYIIANIYKLYNLWQQIKQDRAESLTPVFVNFLYLPVFTFNISSTLICREFKKHENWKKTFNMVFNLERIKGSSIKTNMYVKKFEAY